MRELDVIDVDRQSDMKLLMREFVEYYNNPVREKILNVISLEFSNTPYVLLAYMSFSRNYGEARPGQG